MAAPFWNHVARWPRHSVAEMSALRVSIRRSDESHEFSVELQDVSRQGICLRTDKQWMPGESVIVSCCDMSDDFRIELAARVRWQKPNGATTIIGCEFDEKLGWESIGELFLRGALESKSTSEPFETNTRK